MWTGKTATCAPWGLGGPLRPPGPPKTQKRPKKTKKDQKKPKKTKKTQKIQKKPKKTQKKTQKNKKSPQKIAKKYRRSPQAPGCTRRCLSNVDNLAKSLCELNPQYEYT